MLLILFTTFGSFVRWQWILKGLNVSMPVSTAIRLGMTGQFFSIIMPGAVGGDLIKGVYLAQRYPKQKTRTLSSLLVDRVAGLMGMLLLGALAFLLEYPYLSTRTQTQDLSLFMSLGWAVSLAGALTLAMIVALPWLGVILPEEPPQLLGRIPFSRLWISLYRAGFDFRKNYKYLWAAVGFSAFFHALNLWGMYGIATIVFGPAPWGSLDLAGFAVSFVLGSCALSIPLTPMGLGVGQIAFSTLFLAAGAPFESFGGDLITNFMLVQILIGLLGAIFFITYKNNSSVDS
jgi:uncharacterized membrane protein YbhN (UPF0104 family)